MNSQLCHPLLLQILIQPTHDQYHLYNVFHQTDTIECSRVLIYDFSFLKNTKSIWDKIVKASGGKILSIPLELMN